MRRVHLHHPDGSVLTETLSEDSYVFFEGGFMTIQSDYHLGSHRSRKVYPADRIIFFEESAT